jgi:tRNA U34 5-methylaminomethyl-2-thiouridine-forming methyltransferase MnmC
MRFEDSFFGAAVVCFFFAMYSDLCSKCIGALHRVFRRYPKFTHSICRQLSNEHTDIHLIETSDGSHSLFVPALNETYHSRHGAIQESQWVFIKQGLEYACLNKGPRMHEMEFGNAQVTSREGRVPEQKHVRIHEVGFGTGLNALLAMQWAEENQVHVHFTTLETNVLSPELAAQLNYASAEKERSDFLKTHTCKWNEDVTITSYFTLHKAQRRVQDEQAENQYDVVFYDAFGPPTQPEMWTLAIFQRMYAALKSGGIFVTYCAKGQVRRDLQAAGFSVERLPGPPGKREMLRATKPAHHE